MTVDEEVRWLREELIRMRLERDYQSQMLAEARRTNGTYLRIIQNHEKTIVGWQRIVRKYQKRLRGEE